MKTAFLILPAALTLGAAVVQAGDAPLLAIPGDVLYENKLDVAPEAKWKAAKGKWEVVDGVWRGSELEADHHGAVIRLSEKFSDFVIDVDVKMDGAKATSLTVNAPKDHMARILITPKTVVIRRDDNDHEGPDKAVTFAVFPVKWEPGTWHKVHLEMVGDTMVGQVDDLIAWGSDPLFEMPKLNPGFTVGGESVEFRNFTIRAATRNPEWESAKAALPKPGEKVPGAGGKGKGKKKA